MDYKLEIKLRKLAKKLEEIVSGNTVQSVYDNLRVLMKSQSDYFERFNAISVLKLTIYIYSLKKTRGFESAEHMIENLFFASLFASSNENYLDTCDYCDSGMVECNSCDGSGSQECSQCDGEGDVTCDECDGDGEIPSDDEEEEDYVKCDECNGKGTTSCWNCAGDGTVDCGDCEGYGRDYCDTCNGNGEVETDDLVYNIYEICSWDKELYNILELKENEDEPALDDDEFSKYRTSSIILNESEEHNEFAIDLEPDAFYCYGLDMAYDLNLDSDITLRRYDFRVATHHYLGTYIK